MSGILYLVFLLQPAEVLPCVADAVLFHVDADYAHAHERGLAEYDAYAAERIHDYVARPHSAEVYHYPRQPGGYRVDGALRRLLQIPLPKLERVVDGYGLGYVQVPSPHAYQDFKPVAKHFLLDYARVRDEILFRIGSETFMPSALPIL